MNVKSVTKDWLIIYPNVQKYYASQKMGFCGCVRSDFIELWSLNIYSEEKSTSYIV